MVLGFVSADFWHVVVNLTHIERSAFSCMSNSIVLRSVCAVMMFIKGQFSHLLTNQDYGLLHVIKFIVHSLTSNFARPTICTPNLQYVKYLNILQL